MHTDFSIKLLTGLPKSLLIGSHSLLSIMKPYGLNRQKKHDILSKIKIKYKKLANINDLSEIDHNIISFYSSPWIRFLNFWRLLSFFRLKKRYTKIILTPDYPILMAYEQNLLKLSFDKEQFIAECDIWSELEHHVHEFLGINRDCFDPSILMVWIKAVGDLSCWNTLDPVHQVRLSNAIFSLSSISASDWFIRDAIRRCPTLIEEFGPLLEANQEPMDECEALIMQNQDDNELNCLNSSDSDGVFEWKERWTVLALQLAELSNKFNHHQSLKSIEELQQLCEQFQYLVPFIPPSKDALIQDFEVELDHLVTILRSHQKLAVLSWLDESLIEQIVARWKIALDQTIQSNVIEHLTEDLSRAENEGGEQVKNYQENYEIRTRILHEIASLDNDIQGSVLLPQRRIFQQTRSVKKAEEAKIDCLLQDGEIKIISAYCPYGDEFDYTSDYSNILSNISTTCDNKESDQIRIVLSDITSPPEATKITITIPHESEFTDDTSKPNKLLSDTSNIEIMEIDPEGIYLPLANDKSMLENNVSDIYDENENRGIPHENDFQISISSEVEPVEQPNVDCSDVQPYIDDDQTVVAFQSDEIPPVSNPFSVDAGEICRPIWLALEQGRLSFAYHAAKALEEIDDAPPTPASDLLAALALAEELISPDGRVASALEKYYSALTDDSFPTSAPQSFQEAQHLLLAAATMRPILLAPRSGAAAVTQRYLHLAQHEHESVYKLINLLLDYSNRLQGFRIEDATFKGAKTDAAWQQESDALRQDLSIWLARAPNITMKFAAATYVWQRWLKPGNLIVDLLDPIKNSNFDKLKDVKCLLSEISDEDKIHRKVQHTDRVDLGRRKGEDIHSTAFEQIVRKAEEAIGFARRWVILAESRPQALDELSKQLNKLRSEFMPLRHQISTDLSSSPNKSGLVAISHHALMRSLDRLDDLFNPENPGKSIEAQPDELLGCDLLYLPDVDLDDDWKPKTSGASLLHSIQEALTGDLSLHQAFDRRIERHDLENAERLCTIADVNESDTLISQWHISLEEHRAMLRRSIEPIRIEIESGLAYGFITEAERAGFEGVLVQYESIFECIRQFSIPFNNLENIRETISIRRQKKIQDIESRLLTLDSRGISPESIEPIKRCIQDGDILSANEFLQRIENQEPVGDLLFDAKNRFKEFFPGLANSIDSALEDIIPNSLRQMVREGKGFGGLDYRRVSGALTTQAAEMIGIWLDVKARKRVDNNILSKLLQIIGFNILDVEPSQTIGTRMECDVRAEAIEDRTICAIPYFGSNANGRYRVVCLWQRPAEEDIVKLVGESTLNKPTLVLYFGRLTERKRREASRLAKQQHRSFLLIDETLLVYLTAQPGSRLAALFDVGLPFTYSTPYDATSSVVPTEMFFGRSLELQAIQGQTGRCFIYGGRQLGKTALLRKAERDFHAPKNGRFARYIDLKAEGIGHNRGPSDIWQCIAREFRNITLISDAKDPNPSIKGSIQSFIDIVKKTLADHPTYRVLLLLDESDHFLDRDARDRFQETTRLKGLMEDTQRRFKVVFAGLHNVLRMTEQSNHPLAHLGEPIKVGPLLEGQEWRDAEDLIRKPFEASGFEFEPKSLITRILAQTNYFPSLIQLYCSHLLRKVLKEQWQPNSGPRYTISAKHVDSVYHDHSLRDEIRTKFQLTLQLDPRYEVIAYTLAHEVPSDWSSLTEGIQLRTIYDKAMAWWPEGFNKTSNLEFKVLLDEMVGLGVLRQTPKGWFSMRNPNVLLLLGTQDEIEDVLLKERELPQEFEANTFRSRLRDEPTSFKRDPLTFQQLSLLTGPRNAVTVLNGSRAAGLDDVLVFLKSNVPSEFLTILEDSNDYQGFTDVLDSLANRSARGTTILVVTTVSPWDVQWLLEASKRMARLTSKDKFAHVLFLADPTTTYRMLQSEDSYKDLANISSMSLRPWQDAFVKQWLEDCGLSPNDRATRKAILDHTGNWPSLLYRLIATEKSSLANRLKTFAEELFTPQSRGETIQDFGFDIAGVQEILSTLAQYGEPITIQDLAVLGDLDPEPVNQALRWAEQLGFAHQAGADAWTLDPFVQRLLS